MNIKVPYLSKKILELGSYSKPLLNFMLENKIDSCLKHYLNSLNFIWERNYEKAKLESEIGLKKCKTNISLYYLLLSNKLISLYYLKDKEFENIYKLIKRNLKNAPPTIRKILNQFLINYPLLSNKSIYSKSRFWSNEKELSNSTKLFILIGKAREKIKEGKLEDGINFYLKGYKIGKQIPHPSGIITCLNDISWYLKDIKPLKSLYFSEKGLYYLGLFYEEPKIYFYILDTSFWIEKNLNYYRIYEISELINKYKDDSYLKERYSNLFKESQRFLIDLNKNLYNNSKELRDFLKIKIKNIKLTSKLTGIPRNSIRDIIKGRVKSVKGDTLRKFIINLNFEFENDTPKEILNEILRIKLLDSFEKGISFLKNINLNQGKKLIIATYISLFDRDINFKTLTRKDVLQKIFYLFENDYEEFSNYLKSNTEFLKFVLNIITPNSFIKGRRELALRFLNNFNDHELKKFIEFYLNLKEKDRKIIDILIRNYERFSRLSINLSLKFENYIFIKKISDSLNLNFNSMILSLYYFSKWERVKLRRILLNLILILNKKEIKFS